MSRPRPVHQCHHLVPCSTQLLYAVTRGELQQISAGNTASAPCTRKKGVNPIEQFGVVRRPHSTDGSSSAHAPAALSRGARSRFLRPLLMSQFARSTWPLVCGCATEAKLSLIPCCSQYVWTSSAMKLDPLFVMMLWGTLKWKTMDLTKLKAWLQSTW